MRITRGRVLRGHLSSPSSSSATVVAPGPSPSVGRRVAREVLEAHEEAARILARVDEEVEHLRAHAIEAAREGEIARFAAAFLVLHEREEQRAESDLARAVSLAKVLAERLLGEELRAAPERVIELAKNTLREARGARRITIEACASSASLLRAHLEELCFGEGTIDVQERDGLEPGSLVVHTDVGVLDARLAVQLDRLTAALAAALDVKGPLR